MNKKKTGIVIGVILITIILFFVIDALMYPQCQDGQATTYYFTKDEFDSLQYFDENMIGELISPSNFDVKNIYDAMILELSYNNHFAKQHYDCGRETYFLNDGLGDAPVFQFQFNSTLAKQLNPYYKISYGSWGLFSIEKVD